MFYLAVALRGYSAFDNLLKLAVAIFLFYYTGYRRKRRLAANS